MLLTGFLVIVQRWLLFQVQAACKSKLFHIYDLLACKLKAEAAAEVLLQTAGITVMLMRLKWLARLVLGKVFLS